jgi:cytoskeletal protein RodZ
MISTNSRKVLTGRTALVCLAVTAFAGVGAAAAATGNAPWQGVPRAAEVRTVTTETPTTAQTTPTVDLSPSTTAPTVTSAPTTLPAPADTVAASTTPATHEPPPATAAATTQPATTEFPTTQPTTTEFPTTQAPTTEAPTTQAPTTQAKPDTVVPLGIDLQCTVDGPTVSCHWSGGVVNGFAEFLLLRGDGKIGRVPFMSTDATANAYVDTHVPAGSYSYVVVTVDAGSKTLVHSNPVFVKIGAAG